MFFLEKNGILFNLRGVLEFFLVLIMEYNVYVFILFEVLYNVFVLLIGNFEDKSIRVWDMLKRWEYYGGCVLYEL